MLIEMLRDGGPELARRWVAALMIVPEDERALVVDAVEDRIVQEYGAGEDTERLLHVREAPVQRDGYVEETIRSYAAPATPGGPRRARARRRSG